MNILVAVESRHGATTEIGRSIAERLSQRGLQATLLSVSEVKSVSGYDAVVLGSAIYTGHWMREARRLAAREQSSLTTRPVWLFSSGPLGDPPFPSEPPAELEAVRELTGAREYRVFAGKLDKSELGLLEQTMVAAVHAPEGDYRDWEAILAFADEIADTLLPTHAES